MSIEPRIETEIKIALTDALEIRQQIMNLRFNILDAREFERNAVFDFPDHMLTRHGRLLRLRQCGAKVTLTLKTLATGDPSYKIRNEHELDVPNYQAMAGILQGIGLEITFIYEKYREVFSSTDVHLMLDETPMGPFLEIEGSPEAIDRVARLLGFSKKDYLTASYLQLFRELTSRGNMVFSP